jgi:hypothetical protein
VAHHPIVLTHGWPPFAVSYRRLILIKLGRMDDATYFDEVVPNCRQNRKGKQSGLVLDQAIVVAIAVDHFGSWFDFSCLGFRRHFRTGAVGLAVLPSGVRTTERAS